jgi:regulator of sigma E protease
LGFDIGGWKFCKFRWGETEYGIGILPLGGYVKMLGQEDNPAKLKEEIERAKSQQEDTVKISEKEISKAGDSPARRDSTEDELVHAEQALYDPRSYLAKSVPKRMAIIVAGVVMNVIFALLMAAVAYMIGVKQIKCIVGNVFPGEAAWRVGMQPGDRILEVAGNKVGKFKDLYKYIQVGDISNGVEILVERPGATKPLKFLVNPDRINLAPSIGVSGADDLALLATESNLIPAFRGSTAAEAKPPLRGGDRIVSINGEKIESNSHLQTYLYDHPEKTLEMTVECPDLGVDGIPSASKPSLVSISPQPMRTLGLVMRMGEIVAVQEGSSAEKSGIRSGDRIIKIDGRMPDDPLRLLDRIQTMTAASINVTIEREGKAVDITVPLRKTDCFPPLNEATLSALESERENIPIVIPQLGIAYRVGNRVERVLPNSPAEKAGVRAGDSIFGAKLSPPEISGDPEYCIELKSFAIELSEKNENWPLVFRALQIYPPKTVVELTLDKNRTIKLSPEDAADWFNPDRGFVFEDDSYFQKANGIGEAFRLGAGETWDSLTMVVKIIRGIGSRQVSPKALGGPGSIFVYAYYAAKHGFATLLLFLTMLSANLAVLNVLPIPVLDGGHLVFLTYEGIRGKPASERVQIALSIIGLILLLTLMIFVCGLDVHRFLFR